MMSVAEEVAFLAEATGQSAADLLALPAAVYDAVKGRTLRGFLRRARQAHDQQRAAGRANLMHTLKAQMGRT